MAGGEEAVKQKKAKQKSAAEKKLEDRFRTLLSLLTVQDNRLNSLNKLYLSISREEALKNADDAEEAVRPKKSKRKAPEANADEETAHEMLAAKRRKVAWNKAEERIKLKRTVFVGNLPVNCSKKVAKFLCLKVLQVKHLNVLCLVLSNSVSFIGFKKNL